MGITNFDIVQANAFYGMSTPFVTGTTFYVDSGAGSDGNNGTSPKSPFATVDYAVGRCASNNGDYIVVMPGHAETVTATSMTLDVAGITIVNVGNGASRPTYTFSAATSTITVSAANVKWVGGLGNATLLDVASAFTLGAAKSFTLEGAEFRDTTAILNFLAIVTTNATDNDADDLTVTHNKWYGLNTTPLAFVSILAAENRPTLTHNIVDLASTADVGSFLTLAAKIVKGAVITDNIHNVIGATGATVGIMITGSGTTSTGIVARNMVGSLDTTAELIATAGTGLRFWENYVSGTADASGILLPAAA